MIPLEVGNLSSSDFGHLQEAADRFEQAWRADPSTDLADFVPPADNPLRLLTLQELVKTDLELRWRRGEKVELEGYLQRFPELAAERPCVLALLCEEWHVRQVHGDEPPLALYQARFPDHFADLERLVQKRQTACHTPRATSQRTPGPEPKPVPAARRSAEGDLLPVGGYRLLERIGTGGFGEVWRAEAPGGIQVAVKIILRPMDDREIHRELEALELMKGLRHQFLLQVQAFFPLRDRLIIVLELADGNLRDRLRECVRAGLPGLPEGELLGYFREAAEALDYLHANHVQHRDVKPDNLLLVGRHAKLADFGLLRTVESQRAVSVSGSGTPAYMAPEVWRGKGCHQSDQYSLAASYAEIRMQRTLFADRHWMQLMLAHLDREPDLSRLGPREQAVLRKALAKQAEDRYPNCLAFLTALEQAVHDDVAEATATAEAEEEGPVTYLLPPGKPTSVVEIDARDDVEPGTLALVELPDAGTDRGTDGSRGRSGLVSTSTPSVVLDLPAVSEVTPRPEPVWHAAPPPPRRWPLRAAACLVMAVLLGTLAAFAWHKYRTPQEHAGESPETDSQPDPRPVEVKQEKGKQTQTVPALPDPDDPLPGETIDSPAVQAFQRGKRLYQDHQWAAAAAAFTEAVQANPTSELYLLARGHCYYELRHYDEALIDYDRVAKLYPTYAKPLFHRARVRARQGFLDAALIDVNHALQMEPNQPAYLTLRGTLRRQLGRPEEAVADLTAALERESANATALLNRGLAQLDLGRFDEAVADFTTVIERHRGYAYAYLSRGRAYAALNNATAALADFNQAVTLDQGQGAALLGRGEIRLARGQKKEAAADFRAAMSATVRDEAIMGAACAGLYRAYH
jgi:serine/threonine protein kinase/Tfp pilus assembly protein PilF